MPARPYREPVPIEPDPAPDAASRLGSLRSTHAPPPLHRALAGPILIGALIAGVGVLAGGAPAIVLPVAAAVFVILAWSPLRTRGFSAALHAHGLVLSRGGARRVVLFEDVDEVWFEIGMLESQSGAYLRAVRLLDFGGEVHRVPLALDDAAALVNSVVRACSGPLLTEARQALAEGHTLTFGRIQLDRKGITVRGARLSWEEIRLCVVQRGKISLHRRRLPILSWRTVGFDRIPNPAVFVGLVTANVSQVRVYDPLLVPLASASEASAASAPTVEEGNERALRDMLIGGVFFLAGAAITWITYAANSRSYVLAYGPIIFGAVRFFQGFTSYIPKR